MIFGLTDRILKMHTEISFRPPKVAAQRFAAAQPSHRFAGILEATEERREKIGMDCIRRRKLESGYCFVKIMLY